MATATLMTAAEFDRLPFEEGRKWELLEGELIPVASAHPRHQREVAIFIARLYPYVADRLAGQVLPDSEFAFSEHTRLRPDIAIFSKEQWSLVDQNKTPITVIPEIAIEVISPSELANHSQRKVRIYLAAGVKEVWQVWPEFQSVQVWEPGGRSRFVDAGDRLTSPLLPDWELHLSDLFGRI